jgi:tetratricopeptide (TPR) repeat protein
MIPASILVVCLLAPAPARAETSSRRPETREARDKARNCEVLDDPAAAAAQCREALALGLEPRREKAVRQLLARRLVTLGAYGELAQLLGEDVKAAPEDAATRNRLGAVLLLGLDRPAEALPHLEEAARLRPEVVAYRIDLGLCLAATGRETEALAALDEARRQDESALALRPAASALHAALKAGKSWP